ncbi:MAG TPA: PAS domain S-box protein [Kiritimatiellia bacterium]|nr:PAS domain S-box protein [Kiritimatiellia bacterium]HMP33651.1 PAS domain S-box protein [Kiritimatiellia bacterium]
MKEQLFHTSIRWRLLLSMAGLGIVFSVSLIMISTHSQREMTQRALDHAITTRKDALIEQGRHALGHMREQVSALAGYQNHAAITNAAFAMLNQYPDLVAVDITDITTGQRRLHVAHPAATLPSPPGSNHLVTFTAALPLPDQSPGELALVFSTARQQEQLVDISRQLTDTSQSLINRSVRISILFLFAGIAVILVVSNRLAEPIVRLTETAQELARGHFTAVRRIEPHGAGEIGQLSTAFATMANELQRTYRELQQTADEASRVGAFLDSIVENLPHLVVVKDATDLRILRVNKAGESILGHPRDAILHRHDEDLFSAETAAHLTELDRQALRANETIDTPEEKFLNPDGTPRYLHIRRIPVPGPDNQPRYLLVIAEDITDRKNTEEERRLFFHHAMDLMCIATMDGRFEQVNPAFLETLGYTREELCSRPYADFVHPDDRTNTRHIARYLNEGGIVLSFENRYICKDGSIRWLTWNAGINHEFKKVYAVARDTTAQKNMEERIVQASLREQERIARDLHDGLGQILTALAYKGKLIEQMLIAAETPTTRQAAEIVALANKASEQARMLARGLDPIVMKEGLAMALRDLAHTTAEAFAIDCTLEEHHEAEAFDKATANHLFRIAQEAVNNAVKHGKARTIRIDLSGDETGLTLSISNNGTNYQAAGTNEGLGIHTMSYRAKLIGGALDITSLAEGGTRVQCTVRKTPPQPALPEPPTTVTPTLSAPASRNLS